MLIYKITNKVNGKVYIGQTRGELKKRWVQHIHEASKGRTILKKAIRKYGTTSFVIEEVCSARDTNELNEKEIYYIALYKSNNLDFGYNMLSGGLQHDGYWKGKRRSPETITKIADAKRGIVQPWLYTPETQAKRVSTRKSKGSYNAGNVGKKHSPETIEKMRLSAIAREARKREETCARNLSLYPL